MQFSGPAPEPAPDSQAMLAALLARVATGDEQALERLYDMVSSRVFGVALQILRDRSAAEEATAEVFTQVWKQAGRYDASKGSPIGWFLTLARTRSIDLLRSRSRAAAREESLAAALSVADPTPDPESASAQDLEAVRVRRALRRLPADQREALLAAYYAGLSHSEVAKALGAPLGTVKTRIRAGLMHLRLLLEETGGQES